LTTRPESTSRQGMTRFKTIGSQGRSTQAGLFPHSPFNPCVRFSRTRLTDDPLGAATRASGDRPEGTACGESSRQDRLALRARSRLRLATAHSLLRGSRAYGLRGALGAILLAAHSAGLCRPGLSDRILSAAMPLRLRSPQARSKRGSFAPGALFCAPIRTTTTPSDSRLPPAPFAFDL